MRSRLAALICTLICLSAVLCGCGEAAGSDKSVSAALTEETSRFSQVAAASEMTEVIDVTEEWMVPVSADELQDGSYPVEMESSSSMFKADHVVLIVKNGHMEAELYMTSTAYRYMFAGTAEDAAASDESGYIPLESAAEGMGKFVLPIEALDEGLSFAAFSVKKEKWYGRTLLFRTDSLPQEAFREPQIKTVSDLGLADGIYTAEVSLAGGSGKAGVQSPARITVEDGACTAELIWSSPNYDYMLVDGTEYLPLNDTGNSVFEIPVAGFDCALPVQADTTAMSQPYLIDYTLRFDSESIKPAS